MKFADKNMKTLMDICKETLNSLHFLYISNMCTKKSNEDNVENNTAITLVITSPNDVILQDTKERHRVQTKKEEDGFVVKVARGELGRIVAEVSSHLKIDKPHFVLTEAIPPISNPCTRCHSSGQKPTL